MEHRIAALEQRRQAGRHQDVAGDGGDAEAAQPVDGGEGANAIAALEQARDRMPAQHARGADDVDRQAGHDPPVARPAAGAWPGCWPL